MNYTTSSNLKERIEETLVSEIVFDLWRIRRLNAAEYAAMMSLLESKVSDRKDDIERAVISE